CAARVVGRQASISHRHCRSAGSDAWVAPDFANPEASPNRGYPIPRSRRTMSAAVEAALTTDARVVRPAPRRDPADTRAVIAATWAGCLAQVVFAGAIPTAADMYVLLGASLFLFAIQLEVRVATVIVAGVSFMLLLLVLFFLFVAGPY